MRAADFAFQQLPVHRRRLRVAVVTETYPPEINGVAMTLGRMVEGLQRRDHQVQLIRPRQGQADTPAQAERLEQVLRPGIPIPRYSGLKMGLPAKSALCRLWAVRRPDLVHIVTEGPLGWSALEAAEKLRIPVATDFHTNFDTYSLHYGLGWLKKPIAAYLRKFHNRARITMVPSRDMQADLARAGYSNVEVVARGVDTALFDPGRRSQALRRSWGAAEGDLVVICVGRVAPEKNLRLLLRAFAAIREVRPDARLVLVGDGPQVAELQAAHPGAVFAGARRGEDLAGHYASADLFVFPSLTETFGNVLLEAMASGLPVLGFDYAAAAEHVRHGENGMKVPFAGEEAFVQAARQMAGDAALLGVLRAAARETALGLSWEAIFDQLESTFLRIVHEHESGHERRLFGLESV